MIADGSDNHRDYGSADDPGAQNPRKRTVMLRHRIKRERNDDGPHHRREQADGGKGQHGHIRRPQQSRG